MLQIEGIGKRYGRFQLHEVSFTVQKGDYFVLLGESGTGKTLILEMIAGLVRPDSGKVLRAGMNCADVPIQKRDVGLVYQDYALFPHLSVRQNIGYALHGRERGRIEELAAEVGASALLDRRPETLSAGEAQRVALARTLAQRPGVLMLDEPLASLDVRSRGAIRGLLRRLNAGGQTIIHVTHDYEEAVALATRVAVLENGTISQSGTPEEVFFHPKSRFVACFVGLRNFFRGELRRGAEGEVARFRTGAVELRVSTEEQGGSGCVVFKSEDVTLSRDQPHGSARNVFQGEIADVEALPQGIGLTVDIGVAVHAMITREALADMGLKCGDRTWVSFKSTAVRFIPEGDGA